MQFEQAQPLHWLADFIGAEIVGDAALTATGINEIHKVVPGDICFVDFEKYYDQCLRSAASIIIINEKINCPEGKALLVCPDPFAAYVKIVNHFRKLKPQQEMIYPETVIGTDTIIQPGVFIGSDVRIGNNCLIHANVTIYDHTEIGDDVIIHSGTVIGADAFYYKKRKERTLQYDKLTSCGRVCIHDGVEIGAGCTIDKGVSGDTIIGAGTKIDNQVHIGHGVVTGKNCLFAAQVGIAGKVIIEDGVTLWGQVGVNKDLTIGRGATVYAQSGVAGDLEPGKTYFGSPVEEARVKMKELTWVKRIPEIWKIVHKEEL